MRKVKLPSPATAIALMALFVALGGTGYAVVSNSGIPDHSGVFHGCVDRGTGALRVVSSSRACHAPRGHGRHRHLGEFAISWSQKGPAGLPGHNGTNGSNGTNGQNGAPGSAIAYGSVDAAGTVIASVSKNIPPGSVTVHNNNYCFTSVSFVPHVINVTLLSPTGGVVGVAVLPPPLTSLQWNFDCGPTVPKSTNSFIVQPLASGGGPASAAFALSVN